MSQSLRHTWKRYRTLQTDRIRTLPIVILMPHSACNCKCVMCDIWKGNRNVKELQEEDIKGLLNALKMLGTRQVVMTGGEALLNRNFFIFCQMLRKQGLHVTLLSSGIALLKHAHNIVDHVNDLIISLDGDETLHDTIRGIPGAFGKLRQGLEHIRFLDPSFRITGRCVIHRMNFFAWARIVDSAKLLGLDRISFLPADISSNAFNHEPGWAKDRAGELMLNHSELFKLKIVIDDLFQNCAQDFDSGFIAESPAKLFNIYTYYGALLNLWPFPDKRCNAPWVSCVIEPDGNVKPCFFHATVGNIRNQELPQVLNGTIATCFRKHLNSQKDPICERCVCYLNLSPFKNPVS